MVPLRGLEKLICQCSIHISPRWSFVGREKSPTDGYGVLGFTSSIHKRVLLKSAAAVVVGRDLLLPFNPTYVLGLWDTIWVILLGSETNFRHSLESCDNSPHIDPPNYPENPWSLIHFSEHDASKFLIDFVGSINIKCFRCIDSKLSKKNLIFNII